MKSVIIEVEIEKCLDRGITDRQEILSKVVEKVGVSRPVIRKIMRDLVQKYKKKTKVLNPLRLPDN